MSGTLPVRVRVDRPVDGTLLIGDLSAYEDSSRMVRKEMMAAMLREHGDGFSRLAYNRERPAILRA
jgi:hypothetical protein